MKLLFEIDKKDYDPNGKATIRPSARAIIFRNGEIAVIYSKKYKYCNIPGGGIEEGEDPVNAMIREVREETGLYVIEESVKELGYIHRIQKGKYEDIFIQDNYYYTCEVYEEQGTPEFTREELSEEYEPRFMPLKEVIKINEDYVKNFANDAMITRELLIMRMLDK